MKDLDTLSTFLGIQASHTSSSLILHQQQYAKIVLRRRAWNCHFIPNPSTVKIPSLPDDQQPYTAPTTYRQLVGALQYLTITQPDLSFSVNKLCQHMHHPLNHHYRSLKRILRYVHATKSCGILISPTDLHLTTYCDADWAGDTTDRRSTTSYSIFLGIVPISWLAKKQTLVSRSSTEA